MNADPGQEFGAESNPTGSPIGGGNGYQSTLTPEDPGVAGVATTTTELLALLQDAESGDIIYIDERAKIDLSESPKDVIIPEGVTLASNRGERRAAESVEYDFGIEEPGAYVIWVHTFAPGEEEASLQISVDGEQNRQLDLEVGQEWNWHRGRTHDIPSGQHTLRIHWHGGGLNLDEILITDNRDYRPGSAGKSTRGTEVIRIEAENGLLPGNLEQIDDSTASGGAYISIPVTLAEDEGPISPGGRIFLGPTDRDHRIGLVAGGENVRITGLCLEGPDTGLDTGDHSLIGIYSAHRNFEVDNCEIWGWSGAAIAVFGTGGDGMKTGGYIHHNDIHHCQANGLGYGVVVSGGAVSLIEANHFDYCRHAIAGSGVAGDGYEARYNVCGPNFIAGSAHNFDMHGTSAGSGTIAGDTIRIHHNTFMATGPLSAFPIAIRGVPREGAYIDHNWFYYTQAPPVWQTGGQSGIVMTDNLIGEDQVLSESGPIQYY
jgi:hypothetical protein